MSKTTIEESATDKNALSDYEQHYFNSYDHYGIHEEMLQDNVRTLAYCNAIFQNRDIFKDKVVLDVGCGTGILSMFAAKSGAKHVIGVEMSNIIEMAKKIVDINGFSDKIILLRGKLEDVVLPYEKVDIIISEWMGYFLLYESMMDTVLYARDKYLVENGLIFPDKCSIYIAGLEDSQYKEGKLNFWQNVYGFDYTPFMPLVMREPLVDSVDKSAVNTTKFKLVEFDLNTVTVEELAFSGKFSVTAKRIDSINGLVSWFDVEFPAANGRKPVTFSTGPYGPYTHWKQTVFYLTDDLVVDPGDILEGELVCTPNKLNSRNLDITLTYELNPQGYDAKERARKNKNIYIMH